MLRIQRPIKSLRIAATALMLLLVLGGGRALAQNGGTVTVALTTTVRPEATGQERELAANLLSLLEQAVLNSGGIEVVERAQLDLAMHELILSRAQHTDEAARLRLGKLATAKLILTAQLLPADENGKQRVAVRISDSLSGAIRGATLAPLDPLDLEATAQQIASYLSACAAEPDAAGVTIAVAPFESLGRFDRLRPLERGLRDMVVAHLARYRRFQVLQRSEMSALLAEIDLIRSGLVDETMLPATLPSRRAAYFLRGTIDEDNSGNELRVVVKAELIRADSKQTVDRVEFTAPVGALPRELGVHVHRLAKSALEDAGGAKIAAAPDFDEVEQLFNAAVADLYRFWRRKPRDFSYRDFRLPGVRVPQRQPAGRILIDSPLGVALLRKSVDRVESVLYLQPERVDAAYALAFCRSCRVDGLWQPERAEVLLRQVYYSDRTGPLAVDALNLLAELYYHHERGAVEPADEVAARAAVLFAFENMPEGRRDYEWSRLVELLVRLTRPGNMEDNVELMEQIAKSAEASDGQQQRTLAALATNLAGPLLAAERNQPEIARPAQQLLDRWKSSPDRWLQFHALQSLAQAAENGGKPADAAAYYLQSADLLKPPANPGDEHISHNNQLRAARCLRKAGDAQAALALLESFQPSDRRPTSLLNGYYGLELGATQEALGQSEQARETYTSYAEQCTSLADNSNVVARIEKLGGVPLRNEREVDVRYIDGPAGSLYLGRVLATDGQRLFVGGGQGAAGNRGILALEMATKTWRPVGGPGDMATCLKCDGRFLWAGTKDGLWRCDLAVEQWQHWTLAEGLPDNAIVDIALHNDDVLVSVGTRNSGGVVRVDAADRIHIYDGEAAPRVALFHLAVDADQLYGTSAGIYVLDLKTGKWRRDREPHATAIFATGGRLWGSAPGREMFLLSGTAEENARFRQAWFPRGLEKAGYSVQFAFEHDGQLWFGGSPWWRFKSVGLYRLDIESGEFVIFSPRDGFRTSTTYECYDGVYAAGRIWLATSAGLAEIMIRSASAPAGGQTQE